MDIVETIVTKARADLFNIIKGTKSQIICQLYPVQVCFYAKIIIISYILFLHEHVGFCYISHIVDICMQSLQFITDFP